MTKVACVPSGTPLPGGTEIAFVLYANRPSPTIGSIGALVPPLIKALGLQPSSRAWDFLSIALAVVAADESVSRGLSPDGWTRRIELTVAVIDPVFWSSQTSAMQDALQLVSGDIWSLTFADSGFLPAPPNQVKVRPETGICLLSGGMDSLIGAIDLIAQGRSPLLVSQIAKGDKLEQRRFAKVIAPQNLHIQLNHNASPPVPSERSQRARSLVFFGLGVLVGTCLDSYGKGTPVELTIPENGFISLNIPLTPLRLGSLSTRTTHPSYLAKLQDVLDAAGLQIRMRNPYQLKTKGEMLAECLNQPLLKQLIGNTTSCGRYARTGFTQCGRCVPCLVRRASFQRWGQPDSTPTYKFAALGTPGRKYRDFDDVRSVAFAVHTVRTRGLDAWIGGALNSAQLGQTASYRATAANGLKELEQFLITQGVL
jgi:hypothetical protein